MLGRWLLGRWLLGRWLLGRWLLGRWLLGKQAGANLNLSSMVTFAMIAVKLASEAMRWRHSPLFLSFSREVASSTPSSWAYLRAAAA